MRVRCWLEYEKVHTVKAAALRDGKNLPIAFTLPPVAPGNSTALSSDPRCLWELQLTSEVPGVDLDATFLKKKVPGNAPRTTQEDEGEIQRHEKQSEEQAVLGCASHRTVARGPDGADAGRGVFAALG